MVRRLDHWSSGPEFERKTAMRNDQIYVDRLLHVLHQSGGNTVLRYEAESISGKNLQGAIFRYAKVLRDLGVGPGTLLAMFASNRPEALAIRYATHVLGAAAVYLSVPATEVQRRALI